MKAIKLPFTLLPALTFPALPPLVVTALVLGSLAVLHLASEPPFPGGCQARQQARQDAAPGFITLAGLGDPACG